jgi:hypothetical protein
MIFSLLIFRQKERIFHKWQHHIFIWFQASHLILLREKGSETGSISQFQRTRLAHIFSFKYHHCNWRSIHQYVVSMLLVICYIPKIFSSKIHWIHTYYQIILKTPKYNTKKWAVTPILCQKKRHQDGLELLFIKRLVFSMLLKSITRC